MSEALTMAVKLDASSQGVAAPEIVLVKGRGMLPHIPHKTLVGIRPVDPGAIVPGDVVLARDGGRATALRVIAPARGGGWVCSADNATGVVALAADRVQGRAEWRCWKGRRKSLALERGRALSLFLKARRLELWAGRRGRPLARALLALPGRALCPRLHAAAEGDPDLREAPYLVETVRAALLPGGGAAPAPPEGIDWPAALSLAIDQGVGAIAGRSWAALPGAQRPPDEVLAAIAEQEEATAAAWRSSLEALGAIVPALRERSIPLLVLKGPAVAWTCYERPTDRPYGDLDLLVPAPQRDAALATLAALGYRAWSGAVGRGILARAHFHLSLAPPADRTLSVELHWGLFDRANFYRIEEAGLFRRAREVPLPGVRIAALSRVDEFIYLCLHLYRHGLLGSPGAECAPPPHRVAAPETGNRLIWFADLLGFLGGRGGGLDPESLRERAREWNVDREVGRCLELLEILLPGSGGAALLPPTAGGAAAAGGPAGPRLERPRAARRRGAFGRWLMRPFPGLVVRPARLAELARLFFPAAGELRRFYGGSSPARLFALRLAHPLRMARRILLGD